MSRIGLKEGTVRLTAFSSAWKRRFTAEQCRLAVRLAPRRYRIEHIGSTAIPGLVAKPIIDIAVRIPSFRSLHSWIALLSSAGYHYKGEFGLPGRHFFVRGTPVTHHLHLVTPESNHWTDWLLFRDFLRAHPESAERYNRLKQDLARRFAGNRDAYTRGKTPLVRNLMKSARQWQARR